MRRLRSRSARLLEAAGVRLIPLNRANPCASSAAYGTCPVCGEFASVFLDRRGAWSLCGHVGTPRRPLDELELLLRLRAA